MASANAGDNGEFIVTGLNEGFYTVKISAPGFSEYVIQKVQVNVSQTAHVNAKLVIGGASTEVSVSAEQAAVNTETAEVKFAIDQKQIQTLQLPNRNPLDLVRLLPGMGTPTGGVTGGDVIVHDLRANSTNITLDGINIADNYVKTSSFFGINAPVVDSVGEFNISTSGIGQDAGFGAAQVSMRTARGTNAYHGAVYWFQRNSFLNANTYFNKVNKTARPFSLQNRVGFQIGGPVVVPHVYNGKNKLFFFASFEAFRQPASQTVVRTVWTQAARTGMFSYVGSTDKALHTVNLLTLPGATIGSSGAPVQINAALAQAYSTVPAPTGTSGCAADTYNIGCYFFNSSGSSKQNRYAGRIDYNINNNHTLEATYNQQNYFTYPDFLNSAAPGFPGPGGGGQESKRQLFSWAVHSTFGTNKTNEARFGLTRAPVGFTLADDYASTNGVQIFLPSSVSNMTYISTGRPQGRNTPVRQATDNFAWVKGHHTIKLGGEWRWISAYSFLNSYNTYPRVDIGTAAQATGLSSSNAAQFPGGISSPDFTKANNLFAFVTGMLSIARTGYAKTSTTSGFVTGVPLARDPSQQNLAGYVQDSWKILNNLTVEFGTRWEYQGRYTERDNLALQPVDPVAGPWAAGGIGNFNQVLATPAATDVPLQYVAGPNSRPLYNRQMRNFAPFVGFAWDPMKDGKTSVRGGFALHYTQDGFTLFNNAVSYADGLSFTAQNTTPSGVYTPGAIPFPAAPVDALSQKVNFNSNNGGIIVGVKPNLSVPYVEEWNFGIEREVGKNVAVSVRYVGNHAVKQYRMSDVNQLNLDNNPYTFGGFSVANAHTEFLNAQKNYITCGGSALTCTGALPTPILSALFQGFATTDSKTWKNTTLLNYVRDGQIGSFYDYLRRQDQKTGAASMRKNLFANFPLNFFVPDPWAFNSIVMDNSSWSIYHGLEVEVRRRFSSGLTFQSSYTWSHGTTDQRFGTAQDEYQAFRDATNHTLEKYRSPFDQRHVVSGSFIYPLPFGHGKAFAGGVPTWADKIIGGWQIQGTARLATGSPFTLTSGRVTTSMANLTSETAVIKNMSPSQLANLVGTFKTASGVFWLNPNSGLFTTTSSGTKPTICAAGQTTPCLDYPGTYVDTATNTLHIGSDTGMGNTAYSQFTGPFFWSQDFSFMKNIPVSSISEQFHVEFRLEMYNVFNHPTFANPGTTGASLGDSSKFGQMTSLTDTSRGGGVNSRNMAFQLRVVF